MEELILKIDNVKKEYKLGQIGGTTLRDELQRAWAKIRKKEDPTRKVGAKNYNQGEKFMALNGVSFEVKKGERVGIIGHNGAGKSTLLKLISRITAPTEGTISMNGRVASMLEVGTGFHPELTGRENVYMNGAILGMTKKEIDAKISDIIEFSEVGQFIDTPVKRYSSGMYVKLAFSVAAHLDSEIMIMDEVLAVGDMAFQKKCIDKMNQVSQDEGKTILYVSHNMNTIRQLCSKCIVLKSGEKIFDGDVETAICKYIGLADTQNQVYYDFNNVIRAHARYGKKLLITDFTFINKEIPVFERKDPMEFKISFRANERVEDLKFFLAIERRGKPPIGTAQTYKGFDVENPGVVEDHVFRMDISNLTPGEYTMSLHAVVSDNTGHFISIDHPGAKIGFSIVDTYPKGIKWDDRWHGAVILNEIELCE